MRHTVKISAVVYRLQDDTVKYFVPIPISDWLSVIGYNFCHPLHPIHFF